MILLPVKEGECDGYSAPTIPHEGEWRLYLAPILLVGIGTRFLYVSYSAREKSWDTVCALEGRNGPANGESGQIVLGLVSIGPKLFYPVHLASSKRVSRMSV
jgi:hypothetical protein